MSCLYCTYICMWIRTKIPGYSPHGRNIHWLNHLIKLLLTTSDSLSTFGAMTKEMKEHLLDNSTLSFSNSHRQPCWAPLVGSLCDNNSSFALYKQSNQHQGQRPGCVLFLCIADYILAFQQDHLWWSMGIWLYFRRVAIASLPGLAAILCFR